MRSIKAAVSTPILANRDVLTPEQATQLLEFTGADGLMIGRGAQGNPWIFKQIRYYLDHDAHLPPVSLDEICDTFLTHIQGVHRFYGEWMRVRIARKHLAWYCKARPGGKVYWARVNRVESAEEQLRITREFLKQRPLEEALAA